MKDNKNVLHITELLLITLFFNATLHRMFGWVNSVKTDFDNWLSQEYIDHCFKKSGGGLSILTFNHDLVTNVWFNPKYGSFRSLVSTMCNSALFTQMHELLW